MAISVACAARLTITSVEGPAGGQACVWMGASDCPPPSFICMLPALAIRVHHMSLLKLCVLPCMALASLGVTAIAQPAATPDGQAAGRW